MPERPRKPGGGQELLFSEPARSAARVDRLVRHGRPPAVSSPLDVTVKFPPRRTRSRSTTSPSAHSVPVGCNPPNKSRPRRRSFLAKLLAADAISCRHDSPPKDDRELHRRSAVSAHLPESTRQPARTHVAKRISTSSGMTPALNLPKDCRDSSRK